MLVGLGVQVCKIQDKQDCRLHAVQSEMMKAARPISDDDEVRNKEIKRRVGSCVCSD